MTVDLRHDSIGDVTIPPVSGQFGYQANNPYNVIQSPALNGNFQNAVGTPAEIAQANGLNIQPVVAPTKNNDLLHSVENTGYSVANTADGFQPSGGLGELLGAAENLVSDVRASIQGPQQPQPTVEGTPSLDPTPISTPVINYAHKSTMSFNA